MLEADKHPNADKLQLTRVDVGDGEPRSIVCGAWNFGAGATVAVVLPGATMPGGELRIEKRKLRGEVSDGMILSERELELGENHAGIMVLDDALQAGTPLVDVLPLGDDVLEIETLYNRPDLTSIYGIAREVAVLTGGELKPMPGTEPARSWATSRSRSRSRTSPRCPRYIGRLFRDVTIGESPAWLKARLVAAGMRPISNVVDVTNYVMLALGNPLHAFDYDSLAGGRIVVRRARPGEKLETLDGTERELSTDDLVIADAERPIGIAGVMGGANTEISDTTTTILLEAANFEPLTVLRSGERHRMRTESQTRWEKGVDPELAGRGGDVRVGAARPARRRALGRKRRGARRADAARADRLPAPRTPTRCSGSRSPSRSSATGSSGSASASTRTGRCTRRAGAPATFAATSTSSRRSRASGSRTCRRRCRSGRRCSAGSRTSSGCAGRSRTCSSAPGSTRRTPTRCRRTIPIRSAIVLPVPLSSQQRVLRTTLRLGLLDAARHNVAMGNDDVELFEVAHVYLPAAAVPDERWRRRRSRAGRLRGREGDRRARVRVAAGRAALRERAAVRRGGGRCVGAVGLGRAVRAARPRRRVERVRARPRRAVRARARSGSSTAT